LLEIQIGRALTISLKTPQFEQQASAKQYPEPVLSDAAHTSVAWC